MWVKTSQPQYQSKTTQTQTINPPSQQAKPTSTQTQTPTKPSTLKHKKDKMKPVHPPKSTNKITPAPLKKKSKPNVSPPKPQPVNKEKQTISRNSVKHKRVSSSSEPDELESKLCVQNRYEALSLSEDTEDEVEESEGEKTAQPSSESEDDFNEV